MNVGDPETDRQTVQPGVDSFAEGLRISFAVRVAGVTPIVAKLLQGLIRAFILCAWAAYPRRTLTLGEGRSLFAGTAVVGARRIATRQDMGDPIVYSCPIHGIDITPAAWMNAA